MLIQIARQKSKEHGFDTTGLSDAEVLLNPKFFKALGKSEGWVKGNFETKEAIFKGNYEGWFVNMHKFIDNLAQDQDIATAFSNATK